MSSKVSFISENEYTFSEANFSSNENCEIYYPTTSDGLKLFIRCWRKATNPDKIVVIVHGFGAHGGTYKTVLVPDLLKENAVVYIPDLRGHGYSEGERGYVERFEDFHLDLISTIKLARLHHPGVPLYLLGESMGTSIVINYTMTSLAAYQPDAVILLACVVAPSVTPRPLEVIRFLYFMLLNQNRCAIPITGREEQGVRNPEAIREMKEDPLYIRKVSVKFLMKMVKYMRQAARLGIGLNKPVFIAQGGKDIAINPKLTKKFFGAIVAKEKEVHFFPQAFHSILNDPDAPLVRQRLLNWMKKLTNLVGA